MHEYYCVINDNYCLGVLTKNVVTIFVRNRYGIYDILIMRLYL